MAGENVIRKDVVQIGFDVIGNPIKEIQSMVNNLTGGAKKAMQGVDGITKEAKAAADSVKDIGNSAKEASNTAKSMSEPIKKTAESAKDASKNLESMAKSIDKAGTGKIKSIPTAIKSSATAAKEFAASLKANIAEGATKGFQKLKNTVQSVKNIKLSDLTSGLSSGFGKIANKLSSVNKEAKELPEDLREAEKATEDLNSGFSIMKGMLANLAAQAFASLISGAKSLVKDIIQVGMGFDASMSKVQAISGATGEDLEKLRETALEYGSTTVFSSSEAADALQYMALAGWDANKSANALGGVLDLAASSGMDLAAASDMVTDYLSAFGMAADKSGYFADVLAYAQSNANTTAEALGEAYKNCAANMNAAGQDMETTTALLSMLANQGLKGSEAGTALAATMRDITAKMKNGSIAIGNTAIEVMDANGNFRDMTDILTDVEAATDGMGDAEKAAALSATFTADSIKGLNMMLNAGTGEAAAFEKELRNSAGTAKKMSDIMNDNLQGDLKNLSSQFEGIKIALFDKLNPALRMGTKYVGELLTKVKSLVDTAKNAMDVGSGLGNILTGIITDIANKIPNVITMAGQMITGLVKGIGQAAPKLITALTNALLNTINSLSTLLPQLINAGIQLIQGIIKGLSQAIPMILQQAPVIITNLINGISQSINMLISSGGEMISGLIDGLTANMPMILDKGLEAIMNLVSGITQNLPQLANAALNCIDKLAKGISDNLPKILDAGAQALEKLIQGIMDNLPTIVNTAKDIIERLLQTITDNLPQILQAGTDMLLNLVQGIVDALPDLLNTAVDLLLYLVNTIVENLPMLIQTGIQLVISLIEGIVNALPDIVVAAVDAIMAFVRGIADNLPMIIQTGIEMMTELYMGIWECIPDIVEAGFSIVGALVEGIFSGDFISIGWDIVTGIVKGIFNGLKSAASKIWSWITSIFTGGEIEDDFVAAGATGAKNYAKGVQEGTKDVKRSADEIMRSLTSSVNTSTEMYSLGAKSGNSFSQGISDSTYNVNAAAYGMGYSATSTLMFATSAAKDAGSEMCSQFGEGMLVHIGNTTYSAASLAQAAKDGITSINGYDIGSVFSKDFSSGISSSKTDVTTNVSDMMSSIKDITAEDVTIEVDTEDTTAALESLSVDFNDTLENLDSETMSKFSGIKTTMSSMIQSACSSVIGTMTDMVSTISGISLYATGQNLMLGLYDGIVSMRDALINTAESIATSISSTINKALEIHSPSKVMFRTGQFVDMGVIEGMKDVMPDVAQTSIQLGETISGSTTTGVDASYDNAPIANYGGNTSTNNYSPSFTLNFTSNGGGESEQTVKKWIKDAMAEVFNNLETENAPIWEI